MLCDACERFRFGNAAQLASVSGAATGTAINRAAKKDRSAKPARAPDSGPDVVSADASYANSGQPPNISANEPSVMILNELLCYVWYYRDKGNCDALRCAILRSFPPTNISEAKRILVEKFRLLLGSCALLAERRGSSSRAAHEAEIDDILGLLDLLDNQKAVGNVKFVAANLDLLPKFGPEELNIAAVVDRQARIENTVDSLSAAVQQLSSAQSSSDQLMPAALTPLQSTIDDMKRTMEVFTQVIDSRLDNLNTVCTTLAASAQNAARCIQQPQPAQNLNQNERSENIIVFGVPEDRDANQWRSKVDDILRYVADHAVDTVDMYRLGRYHSSKTRPILVKLRTIWDRRLILSKCRKLKDYTLRGIYVAPDEPPEVRRSQTFERMKSRAEREGKHVNVTDNILYVDGHAVFSLVNGNVNFTTS